jgi:hypothetical protein
MAPYFNNEPIPTLIIGVPDLSMNTPERFPISQVLRFEQIME